METQHYITVKFEKGFNGIDKGPFLMEMERVARRMLGVSYAEVFMERKGDDSKLRVMMTPEERKKL